MFFEDEISLMDVSIDDIPKFLDCDAYFSSLQIPVPTSQNGFIHYLEEENIIRKQDNGLYSITNLGGILFARKLNDFPKLKRKSIRVVEYEDNSRLAILKEETFDEGYAIGFERAVQYVNALLPSKEDINSIRRVIKSSFPLPAVREAIANSLIHQDFFVTGAGPTVEIFANRVEVTNPGTPLVDINRIIDNPPKSRNEKLASLMRRMKLCEELGRGWDRMVISCEKHQTLSPRIQIYQDSTRVTLFSHIKFANISLEDKIWSIYLHTCIKYVEGEAATNKSLRERFGIKESSAGTISRLIKEAINKKWIKPLDPSTAPRYMKYIPSWA